MNCIQITIDSLRQDHVRCFRPGGTSDPTGQSLKPHTPHLDQLAGESVMFERLRMEALPTVCARRGLFTGRRIFPFAEETPRKGMYITLPGWRPLPDEDITLAEHLSEQGYVCAMVADVYHLMKPAQNYHRGFCSFQWERGQEFDQWQSQPLPPGYLERFIKPGTALTASRSRVLNQYLKNQFHRRSDDDYQAARVFRRAIEWLERNHGHDRFYLYLDSFDPHEPFESPQRFLDLYDPDWSGPELIYGNLYKRHELTDAEHHNIRCRYAAEISMVDHWVGELLRAVDRLGLREDTLIVLLSDHGKILGEWNHYGMPPQDTSLELNQVPCLIRDPAGHGAGTRFGDWLYNTDIAATILDRLAVPEKPRTDGRSVWPALGTRGAFREHAVVGHGPVVSCWRDHWLWLLNTDRGAAALYHLGEDPQRQNDVADRYPTERDDLRRRAEAVMAGEPG